jgi:hypothetical protein
MQSRKQRTLRATGYGTSCAPADLPGAVGDPAAIDYQASISDEDLKRAAQEGEKKN